MLVFSTKLYVENTLTNNVFVKMVLDWVSRDRNYTFDQLDWNENDEYVVESSDKAQTLTIMKYDNNIAFRFINIDNKIIWTLYGVLTNRGDKRIFAIHLYRDAEDISVKMPTSFHRPTLLKMVVKDNYGAMDNDLKTDDRYIMIDEDNIGIIEKIILNNQEYAMPVVYVTPSFYNEYKVNYKELAAELAGVAHVIVERNSDIARKLQVSTDSKNPYNGAVQIYYGRGSSQRLLPSMYKNADFKKVVTDAVFRKMILRKIDDDLSWSKICLKKQIKKSEKDEKYNQALLEMYDNEIAKKDAEIDIRNNVIEQLENELETLKEKINRKDSKISNLEQRFDKMSSGYGKSSGFSISTQEEDFYDNEQKDIVLKVLESELKSISTDPNLRETRKYHVLSEIMERNKLTNAAADVIEGVRNLLTENIRLTGPNKKALNSWGFEIEDGKHYRITYKNDPRYKFTMSKTAGEGRSSKNLRGRILKNVFGVND